MSSRCRRRGLCRAPSRLALAVGYSVRHNTDPPVGFEKTDTLTTINLVYELK